MPIADEFQKIFTKIALKREAVKTVTQAFDGVKNGPGRDVTECLKWISPDSVDEFSLAAVQKQFSGQKREAQPPECFCPECFFFSLGCKVGDLSALFMQDLSTLPLNPASMQTLICNVD